MWQFIKLLLASWLSKVLFLSGIISFIASSIPGIPIPIWFPLFVLVVALLTASYDVYTKQQDDIKALQARLANQTKEQPLSPGENKMRQILEWKGKGISVRPLERLALAGIGFSGSGEEVQFTVEDCTQFFVKLGYGNKQDTIPLQRVEISFDNEENRLRLEVRAR